MKKEIEKMMVEVRDNYTADVLAVFKTELDFLSSDDFASAEITAIEKTTDRHIIYVY